MLLGRKKILLWPNFIFKYDSILLISKGPVGNCTTVYVLLNFHRKSIVFCVAMFGMELYVLKSISTTYYSPYISYGGKKSFTWLRASVPDTVTVSEDMITFTDPKTRNLNINVHRWQGSPVAFVRNCIDRWLYYQNIWSV